MIDTFKENEAMNIVHLKMLIIFIFVFFIFDFFLVFLVLNYKENFMIIICQISFVHPLYLRILYHCYLFHLLF